jgi:hypothetical protein
MSCSTRRNTRLTKQYGDIGKYFFSKDTSKNNRKNNFVKGPGKTSMNNNDDEDVDYNPTIINSMLQSKQQRNLLLLMPEEFNIVDDKYTVKRALKLFDNVVEHRDDIDVSITTDIQDYLINIPDRHFNLFY